MNDLNESNSGLQMSGFASFMEPYSGWGGQV